VVLAGKGDETNRVEGVESGADSHIIKQFASREGDLRVTAPLLRSQVAHTAQREAIARDVIEFEHLAIDTDADRELADDNLENLTPKENELLIFLANTPG